jgi:hypothetical protein
MILRGMLEKNMIRWVISKLVKITVLGTIFESIRHKIPIILFFVFFIFIAFYGPYEYENYLEFTKKYPDNNTGLILNLLRPLVIISSFLFLLIFSYKIERERKKRIAEEEAELKRREAEFLTKREAALKKLEELKQSPVGKVSQAVGTKETVGAIGGAAIGATLGGSLGIAGKVLGTMVFVNGGWVLAGVGAVVGYLGVKAFKKNKAKKIEETKDNEKK